MATEQIDFQTAEPESDAGVIYSTIREAAQHQAWGDYVQDVVAAILAADQTLTNEQRLALRYIAKEVSAGGSPEQINAALQAILYAPYEAYGLTEATALTDGQRLGVLQAAFTVAQTALADKAAALQTASTVAFPPALDWQVA